MAIATRAQRAVFKEEVAKQLFGKRYSQLPPLQKQVVKNVVNSKKTIVDIEEEMKAIRFQRMLLDR